MLDFKNNMQNKIEESINNPILKYSLKTNINNVHKMKSVDSKICNDDDIFGNLFRKNE